MKTYFPPIFALLLAAFGNNLFAGGVQTVSAKPQIEKTAADYSKYLHQHNGAAEGSTRSLVTREMGYRSDSWQSDSSWFVADSGYFLYDHSANQVSSTNLYWYQSVWNNQGRTAYTYDNIGNVTSTTYEYWNTTLDSFTGTARIVYTYDANNNQTSTRNQSWASNVDSFRNTELVSKPYDVHGNKMYNLDQLWDTVLNKFINYKDEVFVYDVNNDPVQDIYMNWNGVYWDTIEQYACTFDANHNLLSRTLQYYVGGSWQNYQMYTHEYNATNADTFQTFVYWDSTSTSWKNYDAYAYQRDAANNIIEETDFDWDYINLVWHHYSRTSNFFNTANSLTDAIQTHWDDSTSSWLYYAETTHRYDANNNDTAYAELNWDNLQGAWIYSQDNAYTYNSNNLKTYWLYQDWNSTIQRLVNSSQTFYYYMNIDTTAAAGINDAKNSLKAEIFPNPSNGQNVNLRLRMDESSAVAIMVYDATGRIISAENRSATGGTNTISLQLSGISNGNYFVQVVDKSNGKSSVLKAIKQ